MKSFARGPRVIPRGPTALAALHMLPLGCTPAPEIPTVEWDSDLGGGTSGSSVSQPHKMEVLWGEGFG